MEVSNLPTLPRDLSDVRELGWIVTFVMEVRKGGPSAGYISSGFFGGGFLHLSQVRGLGS